MFNDLILPGPKPDRLSNPPRGPVASSGGTFQADILKRRLPVSTCPIGPCDCPGRVVYKVDRYATTTLETVQDRHCK